MSPLRHLPPAYSPVDPTVTLRALVAGRKQRRDSPALLRDLLRHMYSAEQVVLCRSGTHALQLAMIMATQATGRKEVVLPAYSCYDLASAALGAGVTPIFYDVDPDCLQPDLPTLHRCLERMPAAVVIVHQFGLPAPIDSIQMRAQAAGAFVIEDAAQAHGGRIGERPLGSIAPMSVLSFGRGKGWTGSGGGALLLRREGADGPCMAADVAFGKPPAATALTAKLLAQWVLARPMLYGLARSVPGLGLGETHFVPPTAVAAMAPASTAVVLATFPLAEKEAGTRRRNAALLRERLASVDGLWMPPEPEPGSEAGYLRMPLRIPGHLAVDAIDRGARRLGAFPSYPRALPHLPQIHQQVATDPATPGAETLARELFTVPVHRWVDRQRLDQLVALIDQMVEKTTGMPRQRRKVPNPATESRM